MPLKKQYISKSFEFTGNSFDLMRLFCDEAHVFFLDSSQNDFHRGRYSFIGFDPFDVFIHKGKDSLGLLRERFNKCVKHDPAEFSASFSPLTAGMVGCLSYDYGLHHEKIRLNSRDDLHLPDCCFGFYDRILTIDHFEQKLHITSTGLPEHSGYSRKKKAEQRLKEVMDKLTPYLNDQGVSGRRSKNLDRGAPLPYECNFSKEQYREAVRKAMDHIALGNIYQVNLSQRFQYDLNGLHLDPVLLYKRLREASPAPFGAFMDCGEFKLISNSPERFLRLDGRIVQTRPMKGTRPRGSDALSDQKFREEIECSGKEKAELLMITDLHRNDLGRVCDYGTVKVKEMRTIEEYQFVFQATSTIEGVLSKDKDGFDLIRACFPGGSITGCPKIRAMEIIEELEPTRRGMYTGSLGYVNFAGNIDFNILIRTLLAYRDRIYFQVGGGIVADSTPESEYAETLVKAKAMQECLEASMIGAGSEIKV